MNATVPSTVRDVEGWLDLKDLDAHGENLTQWEIDFVESLHGWLRSGKMLTDAQRTKLNSIMEERL